MKPISIVGIGASAGGLEALTQMLEHMPADTGFAFVIVQHLDPHHKSALASILARATPMSVHEARGGTIVEANRVYIIPPNAELAVVGGVLRLRRRNSDGLRRSIDGFFQSLAEDAGERAIGVVLSGTASDGTMGLEAIKAENGITFAQDASAKYDSMPRSAIDAGCVDFVLSPSAIAKELVRIAKHPFLERAAREKSAPADGKETDAYRRILHLLRSHAEVDFSRYKPATLQRRIHRRMVLLKLKSTAEYAARLRGDQNEQEALYQDVLINVTSFFRDPNAFKALAKKVFPRIFKKRAGDDPVRVWVAGCSTGQEPYSLAMSMLEFMGSTSTHTPLQIYATDVNEAQLIKARAGFYAKSLVQGVSPERLRRFFVEEKDGYRVVKAIREMCVFARHNLVVDPPFSRMDLISCRNMLIYIDLPAQKRIMPSLHYALKPTGTLFLGASETIGDFTELFVPADKKYRLYSKIPRASHGLPPPFSTYRTDARKVAVGRLPPREPAELDMQREADRIALSKYAPPGVLVGENLEILQFRGATEAYLQPPQGKATLHLLKMAREGVLYPLRAAMATAKKENARVRKENILIDWNGRKRRLNIEVVPLKNLKERCFLVFFETDSAVRRGAPLPEAPAVTPHGSSHLKQELAETREYLQSVQDQYEAANEELQASGEEVQSSNEELQSINEELETSKEELESTNEELTTVNEEMAHRNTELTRVTADLNNLHRSVDMAILLVSRDLRVLRFTPPAEKLFNLMAGDIGRPLSAVKSSLEFPDMEQLVTEVIATVSLRGREVQDGAGRWYSFRARPYLTLDNKIDGAVLTIVDITDLKAALQKAEAIAEMVPPLLILDADLRVLKANRSFCEAFKVTPEKSEGRLVYELGNGQWNIPKLRTLLQDILPRDKAFVNFEVEHTFESIGHRVMLLNGRQTDWGDSGATLLLSISDVTERKMALQNIERQNEELERRVRQRTIELTASNEELEAFCYSVAHDLRNPLRGIEGFSRVLSKDYGDKLDARAQDYCARIRSATHRMSHLIDSLLDLARHARAELNRGDVDLSGQARAIAAELTKMEPKRKVEFVIAPGVTASGDGPLLQVALANLLENAWKFTSKHPRARIEFGETHDNGDTIYFVRDDGAGFDMAYVGKLFETFQRLHSEAEFPGTGIGLTIVSRIIRRHGGRVWAEGAVEGGATFFFSLTRAGSPVRRPGSHE
jgi:two-component system CheB/CheR fusion protein